MSGANTFEYSSKLKNTFLALIGAGIVFSVIGILTGASMDRFWANYLLDTIFFLGISVLAIFFLAAHQIAMAGWYITIKRVPEAMSQFSKIGAGLMLIVIIGVWAGYHNLYHHWNDDFIKEETVSVDDLKNYQSVHDKDAENPLIHDYSRSWQSFQYNQHEVKAEDKKATPEMTLTPDSNGNVKNPYYDEIIDSKSSYLNRFAWSLRAIIYLTLWVGIAIMLRKFSLKEDKEGGTVWFLKTKFWAAIFLVIWAVSSSMMAWDWVMSLDPHWYSTLFGWYDFISLWVASICVTLLILIYLKRRGYMPQVNENHLHNLGLYAFGFSVFWTYLWFSQFMLYWYGNIPEETRWSLERARTDFRVLFYINLLVNFLFPFLVLMRRDAKRDLTTLTIVGIVLIGSHWLDFFLMIMPTTVSESWGIGFLEVGMFMTFAGLFLFYVFGELAKAPLIPEKHPLYRESLDHHI